MYITLSYRLKWNKWICWINHQRALDLESEFQTSHVVVFLCSVSSVKMRCDCSHWWPSLFKLSFRNLIIWNTFSACPSSEWILNGGICYLADKAVSRSWDDAVLYCIAINSLLVHPKTNVEKDFVYSLLRR